MQQDILSVFTVGVITLETNGILQKLIEDHSLRTVSQTLADVQLFQASKLVPHEPRDILSE